MNDLLRNWIPLVNSLLSRLSIHPNEHDECRQAALLRLWKSIEEGKVMTVTFARIRAKGAMLDYLATRTFPFIIFSVNSNVIYQTRSTRFLKP